MLWFVNIGVVGMGDSRELSRCIPESEAALMGAVKDPQKSSIPSIVSDRRSKEVSCKPISVVKVPKALELDDDVTLVKSWSRGSASADVSCSRPSIVAFRVAPKTRESGLLLGFALSTPGYLQVTFLNEQRWHVGFLKSHFVFDSEHF